MKITCPTRQRHNTWYNALRYLVNRNINELDLGNEQGNRASNISDLHGTQRIDYGDDDDKFDPSIDFESSARHAFPSGMLSLAWNASRT